MQQHFRIQFSNRSYQDLRSIAKHIRKQSSDEAAAKTIEKILT